MQVRYITEDDHQEWDKFVEKSPQGSIFSYTWYLDALQVKYKILVIKENDLIKAGIVLAKNQINTYANPMLDKYLGVLFGDIKGKHQKVISKKIRYMEKLVDKIKSLKSFDYYFHPNFDNWIPFHWKGFTQQTRYTYRINLFEKSADRIFNDFHGNLRNDIKYAQKNGVKIKTNIPFDDLYMLVNKTFLRQGSKAPFAKHKLCDFILKIKENGSIVSFGAYNNDKTCIAACALVFDEKSSYLILNGIDINNHVRGANTLMLYNSIKHFIGKCEYYDFEGSMLPGVEQFYRRFGGELTPYMRIWNDNFFNYFKSRAKKFYKKIRYGR